MDGEHFPFIGWPRERKQVREARSLREALGDSADYIVAGWPIRDAEDPFQAAQQFQSQIAAAVE